MLFLALCEGSQCLFCIEGHSMTFDSHDLIMSQYIIGFVFDTNNFATEGLQIEIETAQ
jgi:hypothetical protein